VEKYYRPTILISLDGDIGRGSARSIEEFSILSGLKECGDLLERFGGHAFAAGLLVTKKNITRLRERMNAFVHETVSPEGFIPKLYVDAQIDFAEINESLIQALQTFAPFGASNPEPLFASDVCAATSPQVVGNGHLKLRISNDGMKFDAIGFSKAHLFPDPDVPVRIVFTPEVNTWQNIKSLRLRIKDMQTISS
jgi:single-stranded-DNA-specific exonuclease